MLARFQRIVELIESQGLEHVHEPHIKHLEDKLNEHDALKWLLDS